MSAAESSARYEPLPTLDNDGDPPSSRLRGKLPAKPESNLRPFYVVLLIAAGFAALALFKASTSFKVEEYPPATTSAETSHSGVASAPTESPSESQNNTETEMHSKLSVG